jgi:hypothetical protein
VYRYRVRKMPKAERVSAIAFMPLAILMPIAYALLAPLALFTLDSGSWETRSSSPAAAEEPVREISDYTGPQVAIARQVGRQTGQAQQLPAA